MNKIKICTDSTSDLDNEALKKYNINMVPLSVHFGQKSYKDKIDLSTEEFYKMLQSDPDHPKTSQPTPEDFKNKYTELLKDGSEVISIHLASKMSGTIQSAFMAKNELKTDKIHIVDSGYVAFILGMITIESSIAVEKGKSISEILNMIEKIKKKINLYFIVDTLEYLQKGGRIGKAAALIGGLLNIKPILTIKDGEVMPFEKIRGTKKVFFRLTGLLKDYVDKNPGNIKLGLAHASALKSLQELKENLNNVFDCSNAFISEIGPVVGSHTGPGTLAICFYPTVE